jgi:TonB family protein
MYDDAGDLVRAKDEYQKVNEQGTAFDAWRDASKRITEIQKVLDLREAIASEEGKEEERHMKRFLLAEQLLEEIGDVDGARAEYSSLAKDAAGTEIGAQALYAEAWVLEHRMEEPDSAEALLTELSREYRNTEVGSAARQRLGLPVWKVEKIEPKIVRFAPAAGTQTKSDDPVVTRVEPRPAKLPEGVTEAQVWVRVTIALDGTVEKATVSKSAGEDCDAAAVEAAKATRFISPADGGPAVTVLQYDFPPKPKVPQAPPAPAGTQTPGAPSPDSTRVSMPPDSAGVHTVPPELRATRLPSGAVAPRPDLGENPEGEPPPPTPPKDGDVDTSTGD